MRILYLDLDTLRPDRLGCYGYHRNTSPNIDRIAAEGIRFDNYYASDAPCLPSRAAMFTGRHGIHSGVINHSGTCADPRIQGKHRGFRDWFAFSTFPETLRWSGLQTVYIGGFGERHSAWWYYAGFREIYDTGKGGMESAEDVTPTALDWIERNAEKDNWYLHVNYWDPHTPYRAPEEFGNPFENDPLPDWITEEVFAGHLKHVGPHSAHEIGMYDGNENPKWPRHPGMLKNMKDVRRMMDGYDCGTRYMDDHIGQLFQALEEKGVMDDLTVIISADHGENMGELGIYGEHATADQITCRIPMIVRRPGGPKGIVDRELHYNLDLLPTMADLLGQKHSEYWDGQSFAPTLRDGAPCGRDFLVISQCAHVCQRSVRFDNWLYMRTFHDGYHLFPEEMLFDLENDPFEQHDLAEEKPDIVEKARKLYEDWRRDMMETQPEGYDQDPMEIVLAEGGPCHARGHLPAYCERLEATGRGWAVEELKRRHPHEFS